MYRVEGSLENSKEVFGKVEVLTTDIGSSTKTGGRFSVVVKGEWTT